MGRPRRGIGAELLAVALLGGCLAGTLAAVISVYRRPPPRPAPATVVLAPPAPAPKAPEPVRPAPAPAPAPPAVDPTAKMVAELAAAEAEQRAEAEKAARRIAAIETATKAALAESDRWKRNLALTRGQLDAREAEANRLEGDAQMAGFERDALARRRETVKQALERDLQRPGYAVLPHRGPHGTWQRPIVLECNGEGVVLRPGDRLFTLGEIASPFGLRANSFLAAITREAVRIQKRDAPDGGEVVPYIFFIVRPDGIRSYYEARTRLERIGIAFGYELADSEWAIDVPDLDNPATWDGSPPPLNPGSVAASPVREPGRGGDGSSGGGGGGIDPQFVWPRNPRGSAPQNGGRGGGAFADSGSGGNGHGGLIETGGGAGFGGNGAGEGGGTSAWSRVGERYDPRKPPALASLERGSGDFPNGSDETGGSGRFSDGGLGGRGEIGGGRPVGAATDGLGESGQSSFPRSGSFLGGAGGPGGPPGGGRDARPTRNTATSRGELLQAAISSADRAATLARGAGRTRGAPEGLPSAARCLAEWGSPGAARAA